MRCGTPRGIGLDATNRVFKGQALARDLGFAQGRLHAAQLRDQRRSRTLVERTPAFAGGTGVQSGNGAGNQRVVISHPCPVCRILRKSCYLKSNITPQTDSAPR